jgi:hypothetical protein
MKKFLLYSFLTIIIFVVGMWLYLTLPLRHPKVRSVTNKTYSIPHIYHLNYLKDFYKIDLYEIDDKTKSIIFEGGQRNLIDTFCYPTTKTHNWVDGKSNIWKDALDTTISANIKQALKDNFVRANSQKSEGLASFKIFKKLATGLVYPSPSDTVKFLHFNENKEGQILMDYDLYVYNISKNKLYRVQYNYPAIW